VEGSGSDNLRCYSEISGDTADKPEKTCEHSRYYSEIRTELIPSTSYIVHLGYQKVCKERGMLAGKLPYLEM